MLSLLSRPLALVAALAALPVAAQETAAPAEGAAPAQDAPATEIGGVYLAQTHGDWQLRCVRTETGADPCQLYQLLVNPEGGSMAEITIVNLPQGEEAVAGGTIVTPIESLLNRDITIQVGTGQAKRYPYTFCFANPVINPDGTAVTDGNGIPEIDSGCIARVGFRAEEIEAFRKGADATVTVFAVVAPSQPFQAKMSLRGFTAGYAALEEANAASAAAAAAAPAD